MPTLVLDPPPAGFEAFLERRRQTGADRHDEVWEGVLHVPPGPSEGHASVDAQLQAILSGPAKAAGLRPLTAFNVGQPDDYRVPDGGLVRRTSKRLYLPTAALVVEVVSPGDDTWRKLEFYAAHHVDELLIVDPDKRSVDWLALVDGSYQAVERSGVIALGPAELASRIDWDG